MEKLNSYHEVVITRRCNESGCGPEAKDFIARGMSVKDVQTELKRRATIKEACNAAGYSSLADGYIRQDLSINEVNKSLVKLTAENGSPEQRVAAQLLDDDPHGWNKAIASLGQSPAFGGVLIPDRPTNFARC